MNDIVKLNDRVKDLFDKVENLFDQDVIDYIENFLEHYEYEMAFEGIFIFLQKLNKLPSNIDKEKVLKLGLDLKLNEPDIMVLDDDFWEHFLKYLSKFQLFCLDDKFLKLNLNYC